MIAFRFVTAGYTFVQKLAKDALRSGVVLALTCLAIPSVQAAASCSASATGPAFGIYNPLNLSPTLANGQVTVTCSLQGSFFANVALTISYGTGFSSNFSSRNMLSGASALQYNLYADATYTQVLGDGTGSTVPSTANMFLWFFNPNQQANATIYGRIPAGQDVAAGSYLDTIVVTVTY